MNRLNQYFLLARLAGYQVDGHYQRFQEFYRLPRSEQHAIRVRKLKTMLAHAQARVPVYRQRFADAGIDLTRVNGVDDLARMPILTKNDIRRHSDDLISGAHRKRSLVVSQTGGSTGEVTKVYRTPEEMDQMQAHALHQYTVIGVEPTCREVGIVGAEPGRQPRLRRLVSQALLNNREINLTTIDRASLVSCVEVIQRVRPELIWGYTSLLVQVARFVVTERITVVPPRVVCNGAETMWDADRALIEEAFKAPVLNRYGTSDIGVIGVECSPGSGLHLQDASTVVEIVKNGRPVPMGEPGEIVITQLDNCAMPLIRFAIADLGRLTDTPCVCGRNGPRLVDLEGRTDDLLVSADGALISGLRIGSYMNLFPAITRFQVVQSTPLDVLVRLETLPSAAPLDVEAVRAGLSRMFGHGVAVRIEVNVSFDLTPMNKFRRTMRTFSIER